MPPLLRSTSVTWPAVTVISALAPVPTPVVLVKDTLLYVLLPVTGVYKLPLLILALSTLVRTPYLVSVTAPCALPSALLTIVLAVAPVTALVLSLSPLFAIVNVTPVGVLNTNPLRV